MDVTLSKRLFIPHSTTYLLMHFQTNAIHVNMNTFYMMSTLPPLGETGLVMRWYCSDSHPGKNPHPASTVIGHLLSPRGYQQLGHLCVTLVQGQPEGSVTLTILEQEQFSRSQ